jgi:hypothetical protein
MKLSLIWSSVLVSWALLVSRDALHSIWLTLACLGCLILSGYLPAYSPDLNPIEESFSTREFTGIIRLYLAYMLI